jgi:hypothetical protein
MGLRRLLKDWYKFRYISDRKYIEQQYLQVMGYPLNLDNPILLNEKIQWLKLYDRNKQYNLYADKYRVREYVKNKIGEQYLIPIYKVIPKNKKLTSSDFPDYPVVIKANHNSGGTKIIFNKNSIDLKLLNRTCNNWLRENYYYVSKEAQYKHIKPLLFIEKLLLDENENIPEDLKLHCFNGKVELISIDSNRFTNHCRDFYDRDWNKIDMIWSLFKNGKPTSPNSDVTIPKPEILDHLIEVAEKLASEFKYVRVDLYIVKKQIYFGELTLHHGGGFQEILPKSKAIELGKLIDLETIKS